MRIEFTNRYKILEFKFNLRGANKLLKSLKQDVNFF